MTISSETFKKDPDKYLNQVAASGSSFTIMTPNGESVRLVPVEDEKESFDGFDYFNDPEFLAADAEAEADIKAGRVYTKEEAFKIMDDMVAELKQRCNLE